MMRDSFISDTRHGRHSSLMKFPYPKGEISSFSAEKNGGMYFVANSHKVLRPSLQGLRSAGTNLWSENLGRPGLLIFFSSSLHFAFYKLGQQRGGVYEEISFFSFYNGHICRNIFYRMHLIFNRTDRLHQTGPALAASRGDHSGSLSRCGVGKRLLGLASPASPLCLDSRPLAGAIIS